MSRRLHFGCDLNHLPPPWENFDIEVDIRKTLPFPISSARFILAEHVIEHVDFRSGLRFLGECLRVLEPGGVLRLAFPDILRDIPIEGYREGFDKFYDRQLNCAEDVWYSILTDWGHQSCWTEDMALRVVKAIGFEEVAISEPQCSLHPELQGVVDLIPRAETCVIEATR